MKDDGCNLLTLVREAQNGNQTAIWKIIQRFRPVINKVKKKVNAQERDDLEQEIIEKIIHVVLTYDLNSTIDITQFKSSVQSFVRESEESLSLKNQ